LLIVEERIFILLTSDESLIELIRESLLLEVFENAENVKRKNIKLEIAVLQLIIIKIL
jgi:hypothetical protein